MPTDALVSHLKSLKLFGMAGAVEELAEQGAPAYNQSAGLLDQLIKAEVADREVRSINYQMKLARLPAYRDLSGFSFSDSGVNEDMVRTLHHCRFLDQTENAVLIGGPGKTHIATAIGVEAIVHHHRRVRFLSTVELVNALEQEKHHGKSGWPTAFAMLILSFWTNLATCRLVRRVVHCCSICSASCTKEPASLSPPT